MQALLCSLAKWLCSTVSYFALTVKCGLSAGAAAAEFGAVE